MNVQSRVLHEKLSAQYYRRAGDDGRRVRPAQRSATGKSHHGSGRYHTAQRTGYAAQSACRARNGQYDLRRQAAGRRYY